MASLLTSSCSLHSSLPTGKPLQACHLKSPNLNQFKIRPDFGAESHTLTSAQSSKSFDYSIRSISSKRTDLECISDRTLSSYETLLKMEEPLVLDWSYFDRLGLPLTGEELLTNVAGDVVDDDSVPSFVTMAVPKKRTSRTKSRLRKNFWKRKANVAAKKAISLAKSISTGNSKSFFVPPTKEESS